jgi:hypothetical protein
MDTLPNSLPKAHPPELVMSAAAFDKHAVTTHRFHSHEPPDQVLAPMRERWRNQGVPVVEARSGDWMMLSVRSGQGIETVQVRATASGTEGLRSRWVPARLARLCACSQSPARLAAIGIAAVASHRPSRSWA